MRWNKLVKAMSLSVALTTAALMPQLGTPAHAAVVTPQTVTWVHNDDMEAGLDQWKLQTAGAVGGSYLGGGVASGANGAHSGIKALHLTTANAPNGFAAFGTMLSLPYAGETGSACSARIWLRTDENPVVINFEIINPATFTYIALDSRQHGGPGWRDALIYWPSWQQPASTVLIRVSSVARADGLTTHIHMDDLRVECGSSPL